MAAGVEELVDVLFTMVDEAKKVPLSGDKCMIERDRVLDLLDEIKAQLPVELGEAQRVLATKADRIASAERDAEAIRKQAEDRAKRLLSEDELMNQARQRANEMVKTASERSKELRRGANEYCEDALRRTEEAIGEAYDELKRARARFRAAAQQQQQATTAQPAQNNTPYDVENEQG